MRRVAVAGLVAMVVLALTGCGGSGPDGPAGDPEQSPPATGNPGDSGSGSGDSGSGDSGSGDSGSGDSGSGNSGSGDSGSGDSGPGDTDPDAEPISIRELEVSTFVRCCEPTPPAPVAHLSGQATDPHSPKRDLGLARIAVAWGDGATSDAHQATNHGIFTAEHDYPADYFGRTVTVVVTLYGHAGQVETRRFTITLPTEEDG